MSAPCSLPVLLSDVHRGVLAVVAAASVHSVPVQQRLLLVPTRRSA
jgi:hypothetical protein